jgi:Na+-translocating ferredoxin:NAD+ oxidoreductase RnfG subunit
MPSDIRRDLEQRAQEAILKNIVESYKQQRADWNKDPNIIKQLRERYTFHPITATLIGGTLVTSTALGIILGPLAAIPAALLGLILTPLFIYRGITNEANHAKAVEEMLRPRIQFNPDSIQDKVLRAKVNEALKYWELIENTVAKSSQVSMRDRFERTTREVTHWLQAVYDLAARVDKFQLNQVIKEDMQRVPVDIRNLEQKLTRERSPEVKQQLERTIADKQRQLQTLQSLEDSMEKAGYQLDSTISALGTIYSQLLLVGSKDEEGSRVNRLQDEISEQVQRLEDLREAMDEVYQSAR